jgi:hypothetical protein
VQPTRGANRVVSAVINENLIRHGVATIGRPHQQFSSPIAKSQNAHDRGLAELHVAPKIAFSNNIHVGK